MENFIFFLCSVIFLIQIEEFFKGQSPAMEFQFHNKMSRFNI